MGDDLKHVQSGDPLRISARTFNTMLDAARDFRARQHGTSSEARPAASNHDVVLVRNLSDRDIVKRFGILALDGLLFEHDDNPDYYVRPCFRGVLPEWPEHAGKFVVLLGPAAKDAIVPAVISGVVPCYLNRRAERHRFADLETDANQEHRRLRSREDGPAEILYDADSVNYPSLVRLGRPAAGLVRFEMTAALTAGSSANGILLHHEGGAGNYVADDPPVSLSSLQDFQGAFSKMATASGDRGAFGWAVYRGDGYASTQDQGPWEILHMQTPADFWGELKADLSRSTASVTVEMKQVFQNGYNVFQTNFGTEITAYNPTAGGNWPVGSGDSRWWAGKSGDRVLCRWGPVAGSPGGYWIVAVEPNAQQAQTLDVVTDVNFGSETVTKKRIQLPRWTSITDPP